MSLKPLPKNTKVLEVLLQDCSQKLDAVTEQLLRDQDRLSAIDQLLQTPPGEFDASTASDRLSKIIDRGHEPPQKYSGISGCLGPFWDSDLVGAIVEVNKAGVDQVRAAGEALREGIAAGPELAAGFTRVVCSHRALALLLRALQDRILAAIEGRGDAEGDSWERLARIMPKNPYVLTCYVQVMAEQKLGRTKTDVIRDFADRHDTSFDALKRGINRFQNRLTKSGIVL